MANITLGKIIIGGVPAAIILWLLMKYNSSLAWMFLFVILLGVIMVYRQTIYNQIYSITNLLRNL